MGFSSGDFWHRSDICGLPLVRDYIAIEIEETGEWPAEKWAPTRRNHNGS